MSATAQRTNGRGPRVPLITPVPAPAPAAETDHFRAILTPNLDAAVLRVQAKAAPLVRNATGQIQSRNYRYVTLTSVTDQVLSLLVDEDLLWKTWPTTLESGRPGLGFKMTHVPTGEADEAEMPLLCDQTMQALGSAITYGRRYALVAYLNLTIDEDDDGAGANQRTAAITADVSGTASRPTAKPPEESERRANAGQRGMLRAVARERGLEPDVIANVILVAAGEEPRQWATAEHAEQTLGRLLDKLPARLVTPVKAELMKVGS